MTVEASLNRERLIVVGIRALGNLEMANVAVALQMASRMHERRVDMPHLHRR